MQYTAAAIMGFWLQGGGSSSAQVVAAAVALAEASGHDTEVSPSDDYGMWQIHLPLHLGDGGITMTNWSTPVVNARAAVTISANGTNWGPWCTCYDDATDCGHLVLPLPQPTSPAGHQYAGLINAGTQPSSPAAPSTNAAPTAPTPTEEWDALRSWVAGGLPQTYTTLGQVAQAFNEI